MAGARGAFNEPARLSIARLYAVAQLTDRSMPVARAERGRIARAGWLEPRGVTRGRWYAPTERPGHAAPPMFTHVAAI